MQERKYPNKLFAIGFVTNVFFHFFWLFIPSILLLIVGIFIKPCLYIGLACLILDLYLSFSEQLNIRKAFLTDTDNPDFQKFQDALSKKGGFLDNMKEYLDEQDNIYAPKEKNESKNKDEEE